MNARLLVPAILLSAFAALSGCATQPATSTHHASATKAQQGPAAIGESASQTANRESVAYNGTSNEAAHRDPGWW